MDVIELLLSRISICSLYDIIDFYEKRNMFRPVRLSCSQNYLAIIYQSFDHEHNDESTNASTAPN